MKLDPQLYWLGLCPLVLVSSYGEEKGKSPVPVDLEKGGGGTPRHAALLMFVTYRLSMYALGFAIRTIQG